MFRKSVPLVVAATLVIITIILGVALTPHRTDAQAANMNMQALIQSLVDKGETFTVNTRATNFVVDGTTTKITQIGDDFLCVTGGVNVMGNPMQTLCTTFDSMIILLK